MIHDCNSDVEEAFLVDDINDDLDCRITIDEFLSDPERQKEVNDKKKLLVCPMRKMLEKYESDKKMCHFRHQKHEMYHPRMTEWHKDWQLEFERAEMEIGKKKRRCCDTGN